MIHYCEYRVEAIAQWQVCDQVQGDHLEWVCVLGHWNPI